MKRTITSTLLAIIFVSVSCIAQDKVSKTKADVLFKNAECFKGLKVKPHPSIDKVAFITQYQKNKVLWDKAFAFIRDHNLDTIAPGKYPIVGDEVFASVTEGPTKEMSNSLWEFHRKYIDIQMVIKGKEKMGQTPIKNINVTEPYNETKDIGHGTFDGGNYYEVGPGTFLIFFPSEGHRPALKVDGVDSDKKIVIKVKAD